MGKEQRRIYTCPTCNGARVIVTRKRAELDSHPEVQEIPTMEGCWTCDTSGQIFGPPA